MHLELVPESHTNNKHKRDEMQKNKASKSITVYCKDDIEHLNRATYCCGHSTNKGRRIVSGIVRAAKKRERNTKNNKGNRKWLNIRKLVRKIKKLRIFIK